MTLAVEVAGQTDIGCVRTNNEDNFGYDSRYGIFVVCDGMGGQAAGEVASKMGVDVLLRYFREARATNGKSMRRPDWGRSVGSRSTGAADLIQAIELANRTIHEAGQNQDGCWGMGSTIVAALLRGNSLAIGHVGDSRIYLARTGQIWQLTEDHSLVREQVRLGLITPEEAEHSGMQHVILRALGSQETVEADVSELKAVAGDLILMTSDGLTRHLSDQEILAIISAAASVEHACVTLIQGAKDRGGDDNITCLLLKMVERPWYRNVLTRWSSTGLPWRNSL